MEAIDLIKLFLPEGILDYFEITDILDSQSKLIIYLEEKPVLPNEFKDRKLHSHGFFKKFDVDDFPIRKKACVLRIKRRRWIDTETSKIVSRDWDLVALGTRMTSEFALFLNKFGRFKPYQL